MDTKSNLPFKDKLIKATYHSDYELVKQLVESNEFDESIIYDIGLLDKPFPLYYITICFKICLAHDFIAETMPMVRKLRTNLDLLMVFWHTRFSIDVDEKIDYKKYGSEYFYHTDESESLDDLFIGEPIQTFLDNGCRMIDLQLYEAVCKFQFEKVEELLRAGANPDAHLLPIDDKDSDDYYNCLDRMGDECSYLCSCEVFPMLGRIAHADWYSNYALTSSDIGDVLGWAAHEEMYELLHKFL